MSFGKKLKKLRIKEKLTQQQLARKIFVTNKAISSWELERTIPDLNMIKNIAKVLNYPIDYLINDDVENIIKVGIGVLIIDGNKILLGHRCKNYKDTGGIYEPDTWTIPGGSQKYNETIYEGAIREVKEETNIDINDLELFSTCDDIQEDRHYITTHIIANSYNGNMVNNEPLLQDKWKWFDLENLPNKIYSPAKKFIEEYLKKRIKIIIEVGSTNTKIDIYNGKNIKRLDVCTIEFKKNYLKNKELDINDINKLINKVNSLKKSYSNIYVCGTSIFRELSYEKSTKFVNMFYQKTGYNFDIVTQDKENEYTVLGACQNVKSKVCVFVGGGGSTEISLFDNKIILNNNFPFGVIDIMNRFPDLADDIAKTPLDEVIEYIAKKIEINDIKSDTLILAGGDHELFALSSGITYEDNILFDDINAKIMMNYENRYNDTKKYFEKTSFDKIKKNSNNPDWWYATRAMCAFVLAVAQKIGAKYIVPTNINMVYGLTKKVF